MYAATIENKHHTFQASGSLWQDALVMQDLETETLWSQISGKGIQGPKRGTELALFPSSITTYSDFKKSYPNGQLLAKPERFDKGSHYADYFADSTKLGIFGRVDNFKRVPGKTKVIGLRLEDNNLAVTLDKLEESKTVLIAKAGPPVVLLYDATTATAFAYELTGLSAKDASEISVTGSVLTAGGATWDIHSGNPTDGKSAALKPVPIITAFWFAWASFFPTSELIE